MTRALFGRPLELLGFVHHVHHVHLYTTRRYMSFQPSPSPISSKKPPPYVPGSDINPSPKVLETCNKYNMKLWTDLRSLKGLKLPSSSCRLMVLSSRNHCMDLKSMKYLDKLEHPYTQSVLDRYIDDNSKPLWCTGWGASGVSGASPLPTNVAVKKVRHALREALAAYGYDREGRKKVVDEEPGAIAELYGTVRIGCGNAKAILNTKFVDLMAQAKIIIRCIEAELGRDHDGNFIQRAPAPGWNKPKAGYHRKPTGTSTGKPAPYANSRSTSNPKSSSFQLSKVRS